MDDTDRAGDGEGAMSALLTRFELDEDEERADGFLYAGGRGRAGERRRNILQPQRFGYASRPPAGSVGIKLALSGFQQTALLIGAEHPEHRPNLTPGASALYDHNGHILKIFDDGAVFDLKDKTATFKAGGGWKITGDVAITGNLFVDGNIDCTGTNPDNHGH